MEKQDGRARKRGRHYFAKRVLIKPEETQTPTGYTIRECEVPGCKNWPATHRGFIGKWLCDEHGKIALKTYLIGSGLGITLLIITLW